jgi:hypothetical protein
MNFSSNPEATRSRWWGFAAVLGLHVVVVWALTQGLVVCSCCPSLNRPCRSL